MFDVTLEIKTIEGGLFDNYAEIDLGDVLYRLNKIGLLTRIEL